MKVLAYDLTHVIIYFSVQIGIYFYTVFQIQELNSVFSFIFVYFFQFTVFYEWLYFKDKEYNYAQIVKVILASLLMNKSDVSLCYTFSLFTWLHSIYKNVCLIQQEYSTAANDSKKNKESLKKISAYYLINLFVLTTVFFVFKDRLFECFLLFGINIFYLFVLYSQSITYIPYFNNGDGDPNYFIPSSKIRFSIVETLSSNLIHEFLLIIPIIGGVLFLQNNKLTIFILLFLLSIYSIQCIKKDFCTYGKMLFGLFFPLIVQILLTCLFIFVFHCYRNVDEESKKSIVTMIVSVISADLIFNFTAMFILMQENYNKYNSAYLLKNIITKWVIFLSVVLPASLIVILVLDIIPNRFFITYSVFCITICISCSIWLLNRLKKSLNTVDIIRGLMSNTNSQIIRSYCAGNFEINNNDIDTILKITVDAIAKKDYTVLKSVFELDIHWIEKYRECISLKHYSPYFESKNKFYSFIDILVSCIVDSKSHVIIRQFADVILEIFGDARLEDEYKQYHIFYTAINKLIHKILSINDTDCEDTAMYLFNVYFFKSGYILPKLSCPEIKESLFILPSDDYRDFENCYFEPIENNIRYAAKNNKITFLRRIDLFYLFLQYVPKDIELNTNHLKIIQETANTYSYILDKTNYKKELIGAILSDYKSLIHYLSYIKMSDKLNELIGNVAFNSIRDIYSNLINRKYSFDEMDLEILFEYFFDGKSKKYDALRFLRLFCNVVSTYFDYGLVDIEKNNQNRIWSRVIQLQSIFEKRNDNELLDFLNLQIKQISDKYPSINEDYLLYEESWKQTISNWQSYQEKFSKRYN